MSFWDERGLACAPPWVDRFPGPRYHAYQFVLLSSPGKEKLKALEAAEKDGKITRQEANKEIADLFHDDKIKQENNHSVDCPTCGAKADHPCLEPNGKWRSGADGRLLPDAHGERILKARRDEK